MLNIIINSEKLRTGRNLIIYLLIVSYLSAFSGCMTMETTYESPESFNSESTGKISKIILKNGDKIKCKDKLIKFERFSDSTGTIIINSSENADTVKIGKNRYSYRTVLKEQRIDLADVLKIQIEDSEFSSGKMLIVVACVTGIILIIGLIAMAANPVKMDGKILPPIK